jgi:hypothetical protein
MAESDPDTMLDWIFDEHHGYSAHRKYGDGVPNKPYRKTQDVADQLQKLRNQDIHVDKFVGHYGTERVLDRVKDDINAENEDWVDWFKQNSEQPPDFLRDKFNTLKESYEPTSVAQVETIIKQVEEKDTLENKIIREKVKKVTEYNKVISTAKTQADIDKLPPRGELRSELGNEYAQQIIDASEKAASELKYLSDEAYDKTKSDVESASTVDRLYDISGRLQSIPNLTTDLRRDLAREIRQRINELEKVE